MVFGDNKGALIIQQMLGLSEAACGYLDRFYKR